MIRELDNTAPRLVKNLQNGEGTVLFYDIVGKEELFGHARLFSRVVLEPGSSIGVHEHHGEGEIYYILSGTALYNDNGEERVVGPGQVTVCGDGQRHGIRNNGEGPLQFIAIIPTR